MMPNHVFYSEISFLNIIQMKKNSFQR